MERVTTRYNWKDLISTGLAFSEVEITDAGSDSFYFTELHAILEEGFSLNTQADGGGTNITGFALSEKNDQLTRIYGKDVYEKITITDVTYQTGTIYATGFYSGDVNFAEYYNLLQAQIDALTSGISDALIGSMYWFPYSKDLTAYGLHQWAFDNAISQANYPALYAVVGDMFELQHTDAGDSASGAGMFYPTPIPGAYDRVGVPDIEITDSDVTNGVPEISIASVLPTEIRDGTPFMFKLVSGTAPTNLVDGTIYYWRFGSTVMIPYATEELAVSSGVAIAYVNSGSGTFRLTQEGIALDDAMKGHTLGSDSDSVLGSYGIGEIPVGTGQAGTNTVAGRDYINTLTPFTDGVNGAVNPTNETRPKTNYLFGYIKAEHVTSAGETISALRDSQDWVEFTGDWKNKEFIITPADGIGYSDVNDVYDLQIEIWLADNDTPTGSVKMLSMERVWDRAASADVDLVWGFSIMPNNTTSFKLQTGQDGVQYISESGTIKALEIASTGAFKVIITKPNLVNTIFDVSHLPQTVDLTASNVTVTLPEITGVLQTKSIYWTDGGSYKLTLAVIDGATVGGLAATIWEGEGEGHIELESDGSNWQVREYEDSGSFVSTDTYLYEKYLNGDVSIRLSRERQVLVSITSETINVTLPTGLIITGSYPSTKLIVTGMNIHHNSSNFNLYGSSIRGKVISNTSIQLKAYSTSAHADGYFCSYAFKGRWRT